MAVKEGRIYVAVTAGFETSHGRASVSRQDVCFTFVPPLLLSPLLQKRLAQTHRSRDPLGQTVAAAAAAAGLHEHTLKGIQAHIYKY